MQNSPRRLFDRIRQPSWSYSPGSYPFYSYAKPELTLRTLEHYLGRETMARIMRTYHERWRFRHPSSDDFYAVATEVSGRDLTSFFRQTIEGSGIADYEVASVTVRREPPPAGLIGKGAEARLVETLPAHRTGATRYDIQVILRRLGWEALPVDIVLRYEGREPERLQWDGRDAWKSITRRGSHRLVSAEIDPERRLTLDVSRLNNAKRVEPSLRTAATWTARWMFWAQNLLMAAGL